MTKMRKRDRLEATFNGGAVDRPPVSLWRHWPGDDQRAADLARAQIAFQEQYDFDFIKVTPASSFCVEDWGVRTEYIPSDEGSRTYTGYVVSEPEDWINLPALDPGKGALARQLRCLRMIAQAMGEKVPFIQTIFSPLCMTRYLAGSDTALVHLRQHPDAVKQGLETITETSVRFVQEVVKTGAAGIFLAVQHAQYGVLSEEEYLEFGRPYDLRVLEATKGAWFRLLHLHGANVMFDLLADYPVEVVNWHDRETPPDLSGGKQRFAGAVCGGLRQIETMIHATPEEVKAEAADAMDQTNGERFILGTGCVTPITSPTSNIHAAREAVEHA